MPRRLRVHLDNAAASFWRESYRELRRHAGDERLPYRLRTRLRAIADDAYRRCARAEARMVVPLCSRRALRAAARTGVPAEEARRTRGVLAERGITAERPIVAIEVRSRGDLFSGAIDLLSAEGYQVVQIGDSSAGLLRGPGVIHATSSANRAAALEAHLLLASAFVICGSAELQWAAARAGTPSLRVDARDPFTAYPVRHDGLFTLATVVDLDTGRQLPIAELLTERYFRHARNCGYRPTSAGDVTAAVREMLDGVRGGWRDTDAQARFRRLVTGAGVALGRRVRHIVEWDAARGFVGDGRLARVQAEQAP